MKATGLLTLMLGLCGLAHAASLASVHIIAGGEERMHFEGDKPDYPQGRYQALSCTNAGCSISDTQVVLRKSMVWNYGDASEPHPGFTLEVPGGRQVLALFQGIPGLKSGPVTTWYARNDAEENTILVAGNVISRGNSLLALRLPQAEMRFSVSHLKPGSAASRKLGCSKGAAVWTLRHGGEEQALTHVCAESVDDVNGGGPPALERYVRWVGDVDGDGLPDLVVMPDACTVSAALYLSRQKAAAKDWQPAATFSYYAPTNDGC